MRDKFCKSEWEWPASRYELFLLFLLFFIMKSIMTEVLNIHYEYSVELVDSAEKTIVRYINSLMC